MKIPTASQHVDQGHVPERNLVVLPVFRRTVKEEGTQSNPEKRAVVEATEAAAEKNGGAVAVRQEEAAVPL